MKLWMQIVSMTIIAIIVHVILSGQVVLFGSLYRFGGARDTHTGSGDLMYVQDKKVVTQKITEYTKITNLQNDITATLEDSKSVFVYVFSGDTMTGDQLYTKLQETQDRGIILTNDGLILVPNGKKYQTGKRNIITQAGLQYSVQDIFPIEGESFAILRVVIEKNQELLPKSIDITTYTSPLLLGQLLLQPQWTVTSNTFALCMISSLGTDRVYACDELVGKLSQDFVLSSYGQLLGLMENGQLRLITKEQMQQWIKFIATSTLGKTITPFSHSSSFEIITPLLRGIFDLSQSQGWLLQKVDLADEFSALKDGDIIRTINDIQPVQGRSVADLLGGLGSGQEIFFQR